MPKFIGDKLPQAHGRVNHRARLTAMVRNASKPVGGVCTGMSLFSG
jgi:hypothetical protein